MTIDARKNFALGTIAVAPSPAASGLALILAAGQGLLMPTSAFNATVWPPGVMPTKANAEIVRVESISGDIVTISARGQEETQAKPIEAGWQFGDMLTAKTVDDLKAAIEGATSGADPAGSAAAAETKAIAAAATKATAAQSAAETASDKAGAAATARAAAETASDPAGSAATAGAAAVAAATTKDTALIPLTQKAAALGVGTLDSEGHQVLGQVPPSVLTAGAANLTAPMTLTASYGAGATINAFEIRPRNLNSLTSAVPLIRPVKNNSIASLDLTPRGTPTAEEGQGSGAAHIDVCSTDIGETAVPTMTARVGVFRPIDDSSTTGHVEFGSRNYGEASEFTMPVWLATNGTAMIKLVPKKESEPAFVFISPDNSNIILGSTKGIKPGDVSGMLYLPGMTNEEGNAAPPAGHPTSSPTVPSYGYTLPTVYNPTDKYLWAYRSTKFGSAAWIKMNDPSELETFFTVHQTFQMANDYPVFIRSNSSTEFAALALGRTGTTREGILGIAGAANNFVTGSAAGDIMLVVAAEANTLHLGSGTSKKAAIKIKGQTIALYGGTPVAQPAAIAEPAETTAANTKAIKEILKALGAAAGGIGVTA